MPISVGEDEGQDDFMGRCMHHFKHDSDRNYGHEQSIAACLSIYRKGGSEGKSMKDQSLRKTLDDQLERTTQETLAKAYGALNKAAASSKYTHNDPEVFSRSDTIGKLVKKNHGYDDGDDLAYNLMLNGTINKDHSDDHAARIVAQHIGQA